MYESQITPLAAFYRERWDALEWDIPDTPYRFYPHPYSIDQAIQDIENGEATVTIEGVLCRIGSERTTGSEGSVMLSLSYVDGVPTWDVTGWDVEPPPED